MRNTTFWFWMAGFILGFACGVISMKLTERDKRIIDMDIEEALRAGGVHWLYCPDCERWWFTGCQYCRRCKSELEVPAKEILIEFMIELHRFWQGLVEATRAEHPADRRYTENQVAGLFAVKKRHAEELRQLPQ